MASKYNPIARLQKWMDSMAGQTFMQYAYSWGAAVVILGALFKLIHVNHADIWLIIGMGTEVFVFFVAAFERVTEKVDENNAQGGGVIYGGTPVVGNAQNSSEEVPEGAENAGTEGVAAAGGAPIIVGGGIPQGGVVYTGGPVVAGPVVAGGAVGEGANIDPETVANLAAAGQAAAEAQLALSQLQNGSGINAAAIQATDPAAIEEAVKNYAEELTELTEVLGRVKAQAARMSTDSEEMENLNRTLTGIATIYELQLKNISKQVTTIEQIDEQTKRMAHQIEELNNVYARMIKALTVNMSMAPTQETV